MYLLYCVHDVDNFATLKFLCTSFECLSLIHKLSDIINLCTVLCWYVVAQVGTLYNLLKDNMLVPVLLGNSNRNIPPHVHLYTLTQLPTNWADQYSFTILQITHQYTFFNNTSTETFTFQMHTSKYLRIFKQTRFHIFVPLFEHTVIYACG